MKHAFFFMLAMWLGCTSSWARVINTGGELSNHTLMSIAEADSAKWGALFALGGAKKRHAEYASFALSVIRMGPTVNFGSQFSLYGEIIIKGDAEGRYHSLSLFVLTKEYKDRFATQFSLGPVFIWGKERRIDFELGAINDTFNAVGVELSILQPFLHSSGLDLALHGTHIINSRHQYTKLGLIFIIKP